MKIIMLTCLLGIVNGLVGQQVEIDSINFLDDSLFVHKVFRKANNQIDFIEYKQRNGIIKKIDFYDPQRRIKKEQIWNSELIKETEYSYFERDQIIKRYDVINQNELPSRINLFIEYPAIARENQIEGIVEISLAYNQDCIPTSYNVLNKLGHGIDEEVEKKMNLLLQLCQDYDVPFEECRKTNENFTIKFK